LFPVFPDNYQIIDCVHEGPNGTVYRGFWQVEQREVILKCFSPTVQGAYLREMAAAFGIQHPNVNRCVDTFYLADGRTCMVYEYIAGGTLRDWLTTYGALSSAQIIRCLIDLLQALQHLHGLKIIHCDLKPENVLIQSPASGQLQFILSDLGAAAFVREAQEGQHTTGSLAYIAPERLYERFSYNSDLYSLGILAFELLTGQRPFDGSPAEISRAHLSQPPPLEKLANLATAELRDFIARLLEKEPQLRLPSAEAALYILQCLTTGEIPAIKPVETPNALFFPTTVAETTFFTGDLQRYCQLTLSNPLKPEQLFILHDDGVPLVGLDYSSHIEWLTTMASHPWQMTLTAAPLQIVTAQHIAYTTGSRIFLLELGKRMRHCLRENCHGIIGFHVQDHYLLWYTHRSGHLCDLVQQTEVSYRANHYFLNPQGCLLPQGDFFTSGGQFNHQAIWRDNQANPLKTWTLDGSILAWTRVEEMVYALTLNWETVGQYTLWAINPYFSQSKIKKLRLSNQVKQWCHSSGYFFWLTTTNQLYCCGADFQIQSLGQLPETVDLLHISPDHRFLATLTANTQVTIWKNNK